jgi:hypothetical protein
MSQERRYDFLQGQAARTPIKGWTRGVPVVCVKGQRSWLRPSFRWMDEVRLVVAEGGLGKLLPSQLFAERS